MGATSPSCTYRFRLYQTSLLFSLFGGNIWLLLVTMSMVKEHLIGIGVILVRESIQFGWIRLFMFIQV